MAQSRIQGSHEKFQVPQGAVLIVTPLSGNDVGRVTANADGVGGPWTASGGVSKVIGPFTKFVELTVESTSGTVFAEVTSATLLSQLQAGDFSNVAGFMAVKNDGFAMLPSGGTALLQRYDRQRARTRKSLIADIIYSMMPAFADFGTQLTSVPTGYTAVYFDGAAAGGGDGSIGAPYNSIDNFNFTTTNQLLIYVKRGSFFLTTAAERDRTCKVTAAKVQFIAYGDPKLPKPVITGAKAIPTSSFALVGSEYRAALPRTLSTSCMAVCFADSPNLVLPNGTPGSLTSGQAGADSNYVYLKDNPGTTRTVLVSVNQNAVQVQASGLRVDQVDTGYCTNSGWALYPPSGTPAVYSDAIFRDTATYYCGNNGIQIGSGSDLTQGYTDGITIRHTDIGSYNNGINGNGDDSRWYHVEPICHGMLRGVGTNGAYTGAWGNGGYYNDALTAHGVGPGPWYVLGGVLTNALENGIDLVGGPANSNAHIGSKAYFNRVSYTGQQGMLLWCYGVDAQGNIVTYCQQDGIKVGDATNAAFDGAATIAGNYIENAGLASGSAGIGEAWQNTTFHRNTVVVSSGALRSAIGNMDLTGSASIPTGTPIAAGSHKANLFIHQNSGDLIQFNSSNAALVAKLNFDANDYVTAISTAFHYGGTTTSFSTWQSTNERSSVNYANETASATSGTFHQPAFGTPLEIGGRVAIPCYDINGQWRTTGIGASTSAD